MTVIEA